MPKSTPVIFQRTLLAAAVLSLSACSSMPKVPELGAVGDGVAKAGKATVDISRKTWNTTAYLLGFSDSKDGEEVSPSDDQLLIASSEDINPELPLADAPTIETPQANAPVIETPRAMRPVLIEQATANTAQPQAQSQPAPETEIAAVEEVLQSGLQTEPEIQAEEDLIHEVSSSENLWDIAKATTGDANNWHVIADVNDLTQNATVFPGQQLIIPASILKPDFDTPVASSEPSSIADSTQDLADDLSNTTPAAASLQLETPRQRNESIDVSELEDAEPLVIDEAAQLASLSENALAVDLNDGETLWDFAKRTTGNATNWQSIADHNNFTEKQAVTVRPGQTIFVPEALVRDDESNTASASGSSSAAEATLVESAAATATATDAVTLQEPTTVAESQVTNTAAAAEQTLAASLPTNEEELQQTVEVANAAVTDESPILDESKPLTIVEATYKAEDLLKPANVADETANVVENENIPARIMVSGTYYPKAVYNDADFSSSLLMRVSPGTELQVSRAIGTWFEVETEQGVGYVHQRDIQ